MWESLDILKNVDFCAKFDLLTPIAGDQEFSKMWLRYFLGSMNL